MKEVEEFEAEDRVRSDYCGREPFLPHQLSTAVVGVFWSAPAVSNDDLMDAADIKDGELIPPGGVRTRLVGSMPQLYFEAKGSKELSRKVLTVPSLWEAEMSNQTSLSMEKRHTSTKWRGSLECDAKRHVWHTKSSSKQSSQWKLPGREQSAQTRGEPPSPSK